VVVGDDNPGRVDIKTGALLLNNKPGGVMISGSGQHREVDYGRLEPPDPAVKGNSQRIKDEIKRGQVQARPRGKDYAARKYQRKEKGDKPPG